MGKLLRGDGGKALQSITQGGKMLKASGLPCACCDNQPPTGECFKMHDSDCLTDGTGTPGISSVYKVEVAGVTTCTDCNTAIDGVSRQASGDFNRTYYIQARSPGTHFNGGLSEPVFNGRYFGGSRSTLASAGQVNYHFGSSSCGGTPRIGDWHHVVFDLEYHPGGGFGNPDPIQLVQFGSGAASHRNAVGTFLAFATYDTAALAGSPSVAIGTTAETTDFCGDATATFNNIFSGCPSGNGEWHIGSGGTVTLTRCPPCAVDCGNACVPTIEITGTCAEDATTTLIPEGEWVIAGFLETVSVDGRKIRDTHGGRTPAGCTWTYSDVLFNRTASLYIWFDGQDWRAIITHVNDDGSEDIIFEAVDAANTTLACTDGNLAGVIELDEVRMDYTLTGCTAKVTLSCTGVCAEDCSACCDEYFVTTSGDGSWDNRVWSTDDGQVDCEWFSVEIELSCTDGVWTMEIASGGSGTAVWTAPIDGDCPPTDPGAWTRISYDGGGTAPEITLIETDTCPP